MDDERIEIRLDLDGDAFDALEQALLRARATERPRCGDDRSA
jgi:hypothetical protein